LPTRSIEVVTPLGTAAGVTIAGQEVAVVPILRAGLAMEAGILRLIPTAHVGHIGIYRDPASLGPHTYYCKLPPDIAGRQVLLVDPMLATGGSAVASIGLLKERGVRTTRLLVSDCRPRGHPAGPGRASRRRHLCGRGGRAARRPRVHSPWAR